MSRSIYTRTLVILLISTTQGSAFAEDPIPNPRLTICFTDRLKESLASKKETFAKKIKKTPPSKEVLERLKHKTITEFFPDTENFTPPGGSEIYQRTKVSDEQVEAFKRDWDELIHQRKLWSAFDEKTFKKAVAATGGENGYPNLEREFIESHKRENLTLLQLQEQIVEDYHAQEFAARGGYEGWQLYLAPKSPYFVTKSAVRLGKKALSRLGGSISGGLYFAIAGSLYRPVTDVYNRKFNAVASKAADQLPERKELNDSVVNNQKLEKEALAVDFVNMATKEERLNKWAELEKKFKESHDTIHKNQMEIPSLKTQILQNQKAAESQLRLSRIAYLTSFNKLVTENSYEATTTKALALANFKAQEMKAPSSDTEAGLFKSVTDKVLSQIADDPDAFQQFVKEFVETQKE